MTAVRCMFMMMRKRMCMGMLDAHDCTWGTWDRAWPVAVLMPVLMPVCRV